MVRWIPDRDRCSRKEDMDRPHRANRCEIAIDYREHLLKQIGASMDSLIA